MNYIADNLTAILSATLVGLVIGAAFGGLSDRLSQARRPRLALILVALLSEFWLAAILAGALILAPVQANPWTIAIMTPIVIWIGFVVPVLVTSYRFRTLAASALLLDLLHWLSVMVCQAAVLHLIGLTRPH